LSGAGTRRMGDQRYKIEVHLDSRIGKGEGIKKLGQIILEAKGKEVNFELKK
jgi:hypothetical protein